MAFRDFRTTSVGFQVQSVASDGEFDVAVGGSVDGNAIIAKIDSSRQEVWRVEISELTGNTHPVRMHLSEETGALYVSLEDADDNDDSGLAVIDWHNGNVANVVTLFQMGSPGPFFAQKPNGDVYVSHQQLSVFNEYGDEIQVADEDGPNGLVYHDEWQFLYMFNRYGEVKAFESDLNPQMSHPLSADPGVGTATYIGDEVFIAGDDSNEGLMKVDTQLQSDESLGLKPTGRDYGIVRRFGRNLLYSISDTEMDLIDPSDGSSISDDLAAIFGSEYIGDSKTYKGDCIWKEFGGDDTNVTHRISQEEIGYEITGTIRTPEYDTDTEVPSMPYSVGFEQRPCSRDYRGDGSFTISAPNGTWNLVADAPGYVPKVKDVVIDGGPVNIDDIIYLEAGAQVVVTVEDDQTKDSIPGIGVYVRESDYAKSVAETDGNGEASIYIPYSISKPTLVVGDGSKRYMNAIRTLSSIGVETGPVEFSLQRATNSPEV